MLAVAIAGASSLPTTLTYDLGIVLLPSEVIWQRTTAAYWWRGEQRWTEQRISHAGYRSTVTEVQRESMNCSGTFAWLITNQRLAAREASGEVISIPWSAIQGVSVDLAADVVALDGADSYHGELRGPAIAPIAVAAIASCYGPHALLDHPALCVLRTSSEAAHSGSALPALLRDGCWTPGSAGAT